MNDSEQSVWQDSPSQLLNFWNYVICGVLVIAFVVLGFMVSGYIAIAVVLPLGYSLWKFLSVRCRVYELTNERLRLYQGVLNQDIDEIELYRVKDTRIVRPVWLRLFGLGNVAMETSDRTHPKPVLEAVKDVVEVREKLRRHVEKLRDQKRVREVDFDDAGDSDFGDEIG